MHTLWHVLPLCWHSNYFRHYYVFSKEDFNKIKLYPGSQVDMGELSKFDVTPEVRKKDNKYYVSSCYWSNFGGLIRGNYEITIKDNKVTDIITFGGETLYKFNCGIRF